MPDLVSVTPSHVESRVGAAAIVEQMAMIRELNRTCDLMCEAHIGAIHHFLLSLVIEADYFVN